MTNGKNGACVVLKIRKSRFIYLHSNRNGEQSSNTEIRKTKTKANMEEAK